MSTEPCPECKGECCRDEYGYRVVHYGAELYGHVCEACLDGSKYVPPRTYEDGLAEGERRATAAVVAWLRERAMLATTERSCLLQEALAYSIEIGAHRCEETK